MIMIILKKGKNMLETWSREGDKEDRLFK